MKLFDLINHPDFILSQNPALMRKCILDILEGMHVSCTPDTYNRVTIIVKNIAKKQKKWKCTKIKYLRLDHKYLEENEIQVCDTEERGNSEHLQEHESPGTLPDPRSNYSPLRQTGNINHLILNSQTYTDRHIQSDL